MKQVIKDANGADKALIINKLQKIILEKVTKDINKVKHKRHKKDKLQKT